MSVSFLRPKPKDSFVFQVKITTCLNKQNQGGPGHEQRQEHDGQQVQLRLDKLRGNDQIK